MIAFLSDIHSNIEALSVALAEVENVGADRIICLGDVIGYGPQPREALGTIMDRAEFTILGNHEHGAMFYASDFNPRARAAIDWTRDQLSRRDAPREENMKFWNYLDEMKKEVRENAMLFVHGSPRDPVREYLVPRDVNDKEKMQGCFEKMGDANLCFVGHSHVPGVFLESGKFLLPADIGMKWDVSERAIVNIGSVGQPRDGDKRLSFVSYDGTDGTDGTVHFHRLEYDVAQTVQKIRAITELPDYLADRLEQGR
ncbi:MAG: metallophosphoesterase family protein [bacterium]|nr:metallophosphoesterase family protein [bacterium]